MNVSVMITTRNRVSELMLTLERVHRLQPGPAEILLTADGCTDKTEAEVARRYPAIRLFVNKTGAGSVPSRARMMEEATGDLVLALDDDSYPEQQDCLERLSRLFQENPKLAVATFPQRTDEYPASLSKADFGNSCGVRSFPNSGACIRLAAYRSLQGFEAMFFHMYEEPDFALQCVANGWEVLYWPEITIRHQWVARERSEQRNHHRHARNEFWSTLMRCPFPLILMVLPYRIFSQARFAARRGPGWLVREPLWWIDAVRGVPRTLKKRSPVSTKGYKKWLNLPDFPH